MSSADALGIVIEESNTDRNQSVARPTGERYPRSPFILWCLDVALNASLLIAMQVQFAPTWANECDYQIKVWATVWIATCTARAMIMAGRGYRMLIESPALKPLALLRLTSEIFAFAWFLYGINCLFVNRPNGEWCNVISKRWALAGWIFQAINFFSPCACVCLCVPCFLCCLRVPWIRRRLLPLIYTRRPPTSNQTPTPDEIFAKLHPVTFREAVRTGVIDFASDLSTSNPPPPQDENMARSLLTSTFPGPFGAVAQMMARLNSQAENNLAPHLPSRNARPDVYEEVSTLPGATEDITPSSLVPGNRSVPILSKGHTTSPGTSSQQFRLIPQSDRILPQSPPIDDTATGASLHADMALPILTCPICVMEFVADDSILQLPCDPRRHVFHLSCIQEWLRKSQNCPMCRTNIVELIQRTAQPAEDVVTPEGRSV